jgi:hypothetical protein
MATKAMEKNRANLSRHCVLLLGHMAGDECDFFTLDETDVNSFSCGRFWPGTRAGCS